MKREHHLELTPNLTPRESERASDKGTSILKLEKDERISKKTTKHDFLKKKNETTLSLRNDTEKKTLQMTNFLVNDLSEHWMITA